MPFDHQSEANEAPRKIELVFSSGRGVLKDGLPVPPSAYIALGRFGSDMDGRIKIASEETSYQALENQVAHIKALLDACLAEAKASFAASNSN
ncbi:hypothetical protein [Bradyrhizobium sp. USDA 4520]